MKRSIRTATLTALALLAVSIAPAFAQAPTTVIVPAPAPSASPSTVVVPAPGGTTIVAPPGSTITIQPPAPPVAVAIKPWCDGAYSPAGGTNFGHCPGYLPR